MPPKNHREFLHGHHFRALLRLDIHLAERSRTESSAERPPEPLRRRRRRKMEVNSDGDGGRTVFLMESVATMAELSLEV